jgi:hypothetical protein
VKKFPQAFGTLSLPRMLLGRAAGCLQLLTIFLFFPHFVFILPHSGFEAVDGGWLRVDS